MAKRVTSGDDYPQVEDAAGHSEVEDAAGHSQDDDNDMASNAGAGAADNQALLLPLSGKVLKRHLSSRGWGKRILEMDDSLGILYVYRTELDRQRKTPAHLVTCCDHMEAVETVQNDAAAYCFQIHSPSSTRPLVYSCKSAQEQQAWVDGLRTRIAISRKPGRAFMGAKQVLVHMPALSSGQKHRSASDFNVSLRNWDVNQPIGVVIDAVNTPSPLGEMGLGVGDVIIAIDDQACLSHPHAMQLLQATSSSLVTLIVWQRRRPQGREHASAQAKRQPTTHSEASFSTANEPDEPVPLL